MRSQYALASLMLLSMLLPILSAQADSDGTSDHDRARELHQAGEIVAGQGVVKQALARHPDGRVLEIELEDEDGRLLYEVEIVDGQGGVRELFFDARDGRLLRDVEHD